MPKNKQDKQSNGITKAKKSRNGCLTCKKKRLKCDETKPVCLNCTKKNIECGGYATNFKWKSFNDEPSSSTSSGLTSKALKKHLELASFSVTGKSIDEITKESELIAKGLNPGTLKSRPERNSFSAVSTPGTTNLTRSYSDSYHMNEITQFRNRSDLNSLAEVAVEEMEKSATPEQHEASSPTPPSQLFSPNFENLVTAQRSLVKKQGSPAASIPDLDINLTPSLTAILNFAFNHDEVSVPSVESLSPLALNYEPRIEVHRPEVEGSLARSSEHDQILYLFSEYTSGIMSIKNGIHENPWRNLVVPLASKYSCIFNAIASMTLFHVAGSTGVVHAPDELRAKGYQYMKKCVLELANGLSSSSADLPLDVALITCLNLAVSEQWDTHTSSGIAHLKGAKSMIQKILELLKEHQQAIRKGRIQSVNGSLASDEGSDCTFAMKNKLKSKLTLLDEFDFESMVHETIRCPEKSVVIPKSLQFVFNFWVYFEVLAQMTSDTVCDDKGIDLVSVITSVSQNKHSDNELSKSPRSDRSDLSDSAFHFFETINSLNYNNELVDPLLGCGQSLFVTMGKVANLITRIRKAKRQSDGKKRNSLVTISQASELRQKLLSWKPAVVLQVIDNDANESTTWDIPLCIATAEAYRYSTLLYLHQAVPEIPSLASHVLAEKIFILLASIPTSSNVMIVHIFPLLVASCEAEPGEEREWCETRWKLFSERMWIGNIDRAFEVVKEVWKRKDAVEKSDYKNVHQMNGLMTNDDQPHDDKSLDSDTHWSTVMKEWGWEVLLG
ncbi:hypothetical protein Cantr_03451 [Candida viswanathii]|uniref:Zn(2)-C6 fungal-type domain-containing protein n=1 Tax=Candida viswanathii TaxID=5486 RepID=A0A367YMZ5_9ASCO|nr:hypothetical protein Cantr_03451 [Candida viswanathii]